MKPSNSFLTSYLIQTKTICLDVIVCIYACWITYCIAYHILSPLSIIDFWNSIRHTLFLDVDIPPPHHSNVSLELWDTPSPPFDIVSYTWMDGERPSPYYDIKDFCKKTVYECNHYWCHPQKRLVKFKFWRMLCIPLRSGCDLLILTPFPLHSRDSLEWWYPPPPFEPFLLQNKGIS